MGADRGRDQQGGVVDAFVDLADSLVEDYDPLDFLYRLLDHSIPLVGATSGAVLLHYEGRLHLAATSNEDSEHVELLELQHREGPAHDAYRTGEAALTDLVGDALDRWPVFAKAAATFGLSFSYAVPLRLREFTIGALVVFWADAAGAKDQDVTMLRGFADVATIAVLHRRSVADVERVNDQLHVALESRIKIEQAKGMVAQATGMNMGDTFDVLRRYARSNKTRLVDVARRLIAGDLAVSDITRN